MSFTYTHHIFVSVLILWLNEYDVAIPKYTKYHFGVFSKRTKNGCKQEPSSEIIFFLFLTTKAFSRNQIELSKANDINPPPPKNFSKKENTKPEIW